MTIGSKNEPLPPPPKPEKELSTSYQVRTQSEARLRYGAIDLQSKYWPNQNKWMTTIVLPENFAPNWKIMDSDLTVHKIYCNRDMMAPLLKSLHSVKNKGLIGVLRSYDGCHSIRAIRGGEGLSAHAYGLAIDLNAALNPLGADHGGFYDHPDFVKCFTDQGFSWGGAWSGRKDSQHYSFCGW